jgi:alkylation response protein AidB-like acyl-CoA dehydrogenase
MTYKAPLADQLFLLREVLEIDALSNVPGFAEATPDLVEQIVHEGARFAENVLAPLNRVGDKEGCVWSPDFTVATPSGFKEAYAQLVESGFPALSSAAEHGGQGLATVVGAPYSEASSSANMAFAMYPGLTHGNYSAILEGGSQAQKDLYLPKLATGEWCGTMNLTEPHCGTDLGLLRTKAVPQADGTYKITGQKIWISGGEHDLAENIVHLVLARIEGAPAGVKGISLFIVPKYLPTAEGGVGPRNDGVKCSGLEEKMGIHGNATCFMSYEDATGYLIGEAHAGLKIMFVMMNEARLYVGLQGLAQGEAAYQAAAAFAKERLQGRSLTGPKNPEGPADPIMVHPDVRRMLMDSKALLEGGRALLYWAMLQADLHRLHPDPAEREKAGDLLGLLTPVTKAYLTEKGFEVASEAMQIHGGSGFTEHFPVSQNLRDSRITMIYEGTNGIQALDLVGRKLALKGGRAIMAFFVELDAFIAQNEGDEALKPFVETLDKAKARLQDATNWLMQNGLANPDNAAAASDDYLHLFALAGTAYMWARMAKTANAKIQVGDTNPFYANKIATGRHFIARIAPEGSAHLAKLKSGSETMMNFPAEAF